MMLSIGMMVKNESKYLRQCLESLQPIRDAVNSELIIVDTGSTDDTVEIAKEFTDKVYFHDWNNNFSEMRNITISYSKGEWFLVIDGDEVISNPNGIIQFFSSKEYKKYNTACISVKNISSIDNKENYSILVSPRLFRKDGDFRFEGAVHNQPKFKHPILMLNSELLHYGYINNDKELMERKFQRTATILKNELKNDPENIYYLFQLSVSYGMHGDIEEALEPVYNAYNIIKTKKLNLKNYIYVFGQLAKTYLKNGRYKEVEKVCLEAIKEVDNYIDLYFYLAKAQFMMSKNEQAIENYNIYLEKVRNYNISKATQNITIVNDTLGKYENAYLDLITLHDRKGEFEIALEFAKKIMSNNILDSALNLIIILYVKLGKFNELRGYYENEILIKHIELENKFLNSLEQYLIKTNSKIRKKINKDFSVGNSQYSLLNKFRIVSEHEHEDFIKKIKEFDFNRLPNYYGDLLYYLLSKKVSIEKFLNRTNDFKIKSYFNFLFSKYDDLGIIIYEYFEKFKNSEMIFDIVRIKRILATYALKSNSINDSQYKEIFDNYLEYGCYYLEQVYNSNVIENELMHCIKDEEDLFLMYMHLAKKYKKDKAQYLKNLRMALHSCKYMKKGIQMLGEEVSQDLAQNSDEMESYRKKVKEAIAEMINNNNLMDAITCIAEYEEIVKDDSEIYSMKAVIAIMENRLDDAEILLKNGLKIDNNNFDLLYNLSYVYECTNRYIEAVRLYNMAKENCDESDFIKEIEDVISKIIKNNQEEMERFPKDSKYNIMIFANNTRDKNIEELSNIFNILGFINDKSIHDKNIFKIAKDDPMLINLDYIIIFEEDRKNIEYIKRKLSEFIPIDKIYDYYEHNYLMIVEGFEYKLDQILKMPEVELLSTGLSYVETAINDDLLNVPSFNFALSSQDLFYDYNVVKYLLNFQHIKNNLKYCIIGLAYYSFDYDLSKSSGATRVHRYLPTLGTTHNYSNIPQLNIMHYNYLKTDYKNDYLRLAQAKENVVMYVGNKDEQDYIAKHNSQMNYPETVEENKQIFKDYLELLKVNNIKPIIVICPTSINYHRYFNDKTLKNRFYNTLTEFQKQYNFEILDYFESDLFGDSDFWDYSHMNKKGANKFTKILNEKINW